jgi:hypothetical protein
MIENLESDLTQVSNPQIRDTLQSRINRHLKKIDELRGEQVWSMDITEPMKESVLYEGQMKFQKKEVSNRTILANALETTIDTSTQAGKNELRKLKEYHKLIDEIDENTYFLKVLGSYPEF